MGVANDRSIAWGIARAVAAEGATLAFTYQGEALQKRVKPLADQVGARHVLLCDVSDEASIDSVFAALQADWGSLDFVVHAIAFSDKEELKGRYLDTTRKNFAMTMDISCFSFTAVCQRAVKLMPKGGKPGEGLRSENKGTMKISFDGCIDGTLADGRVSGTADISVTTTIREGKTPEVTSVAHGTSVIEETWKELPRK